MGFFNKLKQAVSTSVNKLKTPSEQLTNVYVEKGYATIPAPLPDNEAQRILESYTSFPSSLVVKSYMTPFENGLIRGEVLLLWWLNSRKKITHKPLYFLYRYGINIDAAEAHLINAGMMNADETWTDKGKSLVSSDRVQQIIREHRAFAGVKADSQPIYEFTDAKRVLSDPSQRDKSNNLRFKSTGDFLKDQELGASYERAGDLDNAERAYMSAARLATLEVDFPEPPGNIFWRLAIINRKRKDYAAEITVINQALEYYPDDEKFIKRLEKAKLLLSKQA